VSILSCDVGMKKPDSGIYLLACERLGVEPGECLFIGDGDSRELTGATNVGMTAVLIRAPDDTESGDREDWRGTKISSIAEVFDLL
jgi:putative hydrolase of the HAD superfamily